MPDLSVGSTIAGCRLEAVAGRGGMGVVYRATQIALNRPVAVKAIAPLLAKDADYRERFQRESRLAASIDHPNVIPVYEAGELDGTLYLIMRWVQGTDLRAMLNEHGRLESGRAVRLLRPVASALAAAHRRGLVHRDIKPANVLITSGDKDEEEHVYLTDFGIARRTDSLGGVTRTGVLVGTLDYTAPERIEGGKGTPASDIYAFGCMLFETITGRIPFDRSTELTKMHAHLNDPVPSARELVPSVPESLDAIIAQAMAKDPAQRFGSAAELAAALGEVHDDAAGHEVDLPDTDEVEPPETEALEPVPPSHRRSRAVWALPVLGVAVVAAVVIALVSSGGTGRAPRTGTTSAPTVTLSGLTRGRSIDLGGLASAVSADQNGNVWALAGRKLVSVNPSGVVRQISIGGGVKLMAAVPGGIWVSDGRGDLRLLDLHGQTVKRSSVAASPSVIAARQRDRSVWVWESDGQITGPGAPGSVTVLPPQKGLAVGEGHIWAVNGRALTRVGIRFGSQSTDETNEDAISVALDSGVWTATASGRVFRFNPLNGRGASRKIASSLDAIAAIEQRDEKHEWALSERARTVYALDSNVNVIGKATFRSEPVAIAATTTSAWVATADGKLTQISVP
jgi:serine/threonine protein kinase